MRWVCVESVFKVKVKVRAARCGMKARDEKASISRGFPKVALRDIPSISPPVGSSVSRGRAPDVDERRVDLSH
jgi:hypothetical protein